MNTFFKGKKLLVVGGTSGMGLAVARMVLEAGGSVVLTGNKKDKAEAVQKELSPLGPVAVIAANLMTEEGMETIRREINARHRDISLMVNAAGIFMPKGFISKRSSRPLKSAGPVHPRHRSTLWPRRCRRRTPRRHPATALRMFRRNARRIPPSPRPVSVRAAPRCRSASRRTKNSCRANRRVWERRTP